MTDKINPYAAAPQLMKSWTALSTAIADSLEPSLIELVKSVRRRSTAAPTASTCIRTKRARRARPSSASTC